MDYCGPRGIPHSEFLAWDEDDQQKAIWWSVRERQRCNHCGTHPDDWDPEKGGSPHAFEATLIRCPGCYALALQQAQLEKNDPPLHGHHVALMRVEEVGEHARQER